MIYFAMMDNFIKIGFTNKTDAQERIDELNTSSAKRVELLRAIPGGRELEKELHKRYENYRRNGEWFDCHYDLIKYIIDYGNNDKKEIAAGDIEKIAINLIYKAIGIIETIIISVPEPQDYLNEYLAEWKRVQRTLTDMYARYVVSPSKYNTIILEEINAAFTLLTTVSLSGIIEQYYSTSNRVSSVENSFVNPSKDNGHVPWIETDIFEGNYCDSINDKRGIAIRREWYINFYRNLYEARNKIEYLYNVSCAEKANNQ